MQVDAAPLADIEVVGSDHVDALDLLHRQVVLQRDDLATGVDVGADPEVAVVAAFNLGALGVVTLDTLGEDEFLAQLVDAILDLDVVVIDGHGEPFQEVGGQHDTVGVGVRLLRRQVRVAALQVVVLARRAVEVAAPLGSGDAAAGTLFEAIAAGGTSIRTRVRRHVEQVQALGQEQLLDVGSAHRALVAAAQLDLLVDGPAQTDTVGIGSLTVVVVGVAVAAIQHDLLSPVLAFHQRYAGFHKALFHVIAAVHRLGGTTLASAQAQAVTLVGAEAHALLAVFNTDNHIDAVIRPGQLDPVVPQGTLNIGRGNGLLSVAVRVQGNGQVINLLLGDGAFLEHVIRHTVGVVTVQRRLTDDFAAVRIDHRVQGALDVVDIEVILVGVGVIHPGVLEVTVVAPGVIDFATQAEHTTESVVLELVLAVAALDIPLAEVGRLDVVLGEPVLAAEGLELLVGHEGIATGYIGVVEERSRGRYL